MQTIKIHSRDRVTNRGFSSRFNLNEFTIDEDYVEFFHLDLYGDGVYTGESKNWKTYIFCLEHKGTIETVQQGVTYSYKFNEGDIVIIEKYTKYTIFGDTKLHIIHTLI